MGLCVVVSVSVSLWRRAVLHPAAVSAAPPARAEAPHLTPSAPMAHFAGPLGPGEASRLRPRRLAPPAQCPAPQPAPRARMVSTHTLYVVSGAPERGRNLPTCRSHTTHHIPRTLRSAATSRAATSCEAVQPFICTLRRLGRRAGGSLLGAGTGTRSQVMMGSARAPCRTRKPRSHERPVLTQEGREPPPPLPVEPHPQLHRVPLQLPGRAVEQEAAAAPRRQRQ